MSDEQDGELNVSGVYMPRFFVEPLTLSSKKDRERRNLTYVPPTPRPHYVRSAPSQTRTRLLHSRIHDESRGDLDSSFNLLMQNTRLKKGSESTLTIFREFFEIQSRLGFGSFGDVYCCKNKVDGKEYAVKKSRRTYNGEVDRGRQLLEVQRVVGIPPHNHLVALENAWEEDGHLYLQMELCAKSLNQYIEEGHQLDEETSWNILIDMLHALNHLHKHHLVHLDVKTDNILLSKDAPTVYKLGDFGIVVSLDEKRDVNDFTEGDSRYLAPEVMQGDISTKADVFSLGITILEISCHVDLPKSGELWHKLRQGGKLPSPCDELLPDSLREVIGLMLQPEVSLRPDIDHLLTLPIVTKKLRRRKWTSLIVAGRRRKVAVPATQSQQRSSTPETAQPEILVNDNSFSDDDDLIPTKTSTPVFASTPISGSKSKAKSSARYRTGRFSRIPENADGLTPASRNLLKEFEAASD